MREPARPRVLLVEDEGGVALMIEDMLKELGCELAASVARLAGAFEALDSTQLDFVILDVNVANELSFDFARTLVARGIPFVFSTGYGHGCLPADLQDRPVVAKPYRLGQLHQAIAALRETQ
jgi:two-component SAPR family response regulator